MTDRRFRRSRVARLTDDEGLLDELAAEHDDLSEEEQVERNAFIDEHSDDDVRALYGDRLAAPASDEDTQADEDTPKRGRRRTQAGGTNDDDGQ